MSLDPTILRALRAEAHQHAGGHQHQVQAHLETLDTVTARWLLQALRDGRVAKQNASRMRREPWRVIR